MEESLFPLQTLPWRELRSGYAEIIKHSLIADAAQWKGLQQLHRLDEAGWEAAVAGRRVVSILDGVSLPDLGVAGSERLTGPQTSVCSPAR